MPRITLPDGSVKEYEQPVFAFQVAADIGKRLAQAALGCTVNGELHDLSTLLDNDCDLSLITATTRAGDLDDNALYLMRHSCAHVMAEAIQRVVPGVLLVYGPPVDNGYYYDMYVPDGRPLSSDDFEQIEAEMAKIVKEDRPFTRYDMPVGEGMEKLKDEGSKYKVDNAERAVEAGSEELSWYATGEPGKDWEDLCRGPHVPSTGRIGAFKLMSLASSYWHGDADSDRLTRVYGTCFPDKKTLDTYLEQLEEAKRRDHRTLNKTLRLFHIDEAVGQGLALWTPRGAVVRQELQTFIAEELRKQGYDQVFTPHIGKLGLYRTSGHFPYYRDSQYPPIIGHDQLEKLAHEGCSCSDLSNRLGEGDVDGYLLKPMNCPHHMKIYASEPRSYRDLPVRLAEFGTVYRWEQSGEVNGLTRVRGFTQDDAHLFCTPDQLHDEMLGCLELVKTIFGVLGMKDYRVRVGLREPGSDKYVGEPANWDKAEQACRDAATTLGVPFTEEEGEAAFYGPKIDFVVRDVIGREWQLGTVQVDYNLPERFDLSYIGTDSQPHRPVVIHRAPFGSMERFVGVLIEHFAGAFPTWLAPEQVRVLPISDKFMDYAQEVRSLLHGQRRRVELDESPERVQAKIRNAQEMKLPYMLIVGGRDRDGRTVSVRHRTEGEVGAMPLEAFCEALAEEIESKGRATVLDKLKVDAV
jgi:threonyl-tRNA synthetase